MISIIICSISEERLQAVKQNIAQTIGCDHEFIAIDNTQKKWSISKVYNYAAQQANYPYLFFVHEDVRFHSQNWGPFIEDKLKEPDCGAIGFVGCKIKFKAYSGWPQFKWNHALLYQRKAKSTTLEAANITLEHPFEEAVAIDGLGLFVPKKVWSLYPFDEALLSGFHCYDLDFTLQIAADNKYKNYICCSPKVLIEHFSLGNLDHNWYKDTIRLHKQKWNALLPLKTSDLYIDKKTEKKYEERCFNKFTRDLLKTNLPERKSILIEFLLLPFSWKHLAHCFSRVFQYLTS